MDSVLKLSKFVFLGSTHNYLFFGVISSTKNVKKDAICLKLFWYKVLVHRQKIKVTQFLNGFRPKKGNNSKLLNMLVVIVILRNNRWQSMQ